MLVCCVCISVFVLLFEFGWQGGGVVQHSLRHANTVDVLDVNRLGVARVHNVTRVTFY